MSCWSSVETNTLYLFVIPVVGVDAAADCLDIVGARCEIAVRIKPYLSKHDKLNPASWLRDRRQAR